ncbi:MAG TPA: 1-acyl-sn-glycerol-3-phosphate acyltransferase [Actinomycetota bacterium]|nr:1-acyl-sn-glycerol-3-phosphate acyltransferase [Actinomycetota bacterium]
MDRLPPRIVRRLVLAPLAVLICIAILAVSPALLAAAAVADLFLPGSWRTTRLVAFVVCYLVLELVGFAAMLVLWVASGFGVAMRSDRVQGWHYGFMAWWLRMMDGVVRRLFRLRIHIEERPVPRPGPVLVFSRHAGPGNSLLLIGTILVGYGRRPRIVMLAKLQWEPLYDIMLNRVPNRFIRHDPSRRHLYMDAIAGLATGLGDSDAFVLFPEGKDFTPRVRRRAIEYLRGKGHEQAADRAERMEHVLPPRHGGVMAALNAAPDADVVFVAHAVLEDIGTFKQIWSSIPLTHPVRARYWRVPAAEVPRDEQELIEWLYDWWERIDAWLTEHVAAV